jgi:hypothetical protein
MSNKHKNIVVFALMIFLIALMPAWVFASTATKAPGTTSPVPLCSDLVASLKLTKSLAGNIGTITLEATICNKGNADYIGQDPLDAYFFVITWHPPKTAAQESDLKTISHTPLVNRLNKGECRTVTVKYIIPGKVSRWVDENIRVIPAADEKLAIKEFTISIEKKYPVQAGDKSFSPAEDCNNQNTHASQTIKYMEKI